MLSAKGELKKNISPLLEDDNFTNRDADKAEIFNAFFTSVLKACGPLEPWVVKVWLWEWYSPSCLVQNLLLQVNAHKCMEPNGILLGELRKLANVIKRQISVIYQ